MSADTQTSGATRSTPVLEPWQGGVIGGILGGVVFGALMTMQTPGVLEDAIPQLYGLGTDAGAIGWVLHVSHAAVLGVVFVAIVESSSLDEALDDNLRNALAGLAYGAVVWGVLAAVVMPLWLDAAGAMAPDVPNVVTESLVGHLAYGVVLGLTYSVLTD